MTTIAIKKMADLSDVRGFLVTATVPENSVECDRCGVLIPDRAPLFMCTTSSTPRDEMVVRAMIGLCCFESAHAAVYEGRRHRGESL